jgi:CheY-like chemotaxis protein
MDTDRRRVLAVDCSADAADSLTTLLCLWGYNGVARYDGASALASARVHRPDVVVAEIALPGMDGCRFAELLHGLPGCAKVPVIAITGHTQQACRDRAHDAGIDHYLLKPADPDRVRELLGRLVQEGDPPTTTTVSGRRHPFPQEAGR